MTERDLELLLRHLADHDVRVVAVGRDDDGVGVLDPRPLQQLDVHPVADVELARPVVAEPHHRILALVDDADLPAGVAQLERDGAADAAASDHDNLHARPA